MKKRKNSNPFTNSVLDDEEKLLEEALEKGEFERYTNLNEL